MHDIHPYRYTNGFRGQLQRIDRLYGDLSTANAGPAFMERVSIEHTGKSPRLMAERDERLRHLDRLIHDWRVDGELLAYASVDTNSQPTSSVFFDDICRPVSFLHFDPSPALQISAAPRTRIEGCYLRDVVHDGTFKVEVTFVCHEPGWKTIDTCLFGDAMVVGARVATGSIPMGDEISVSDVIALLEGDDQIVADPALICAVVSASTCAMSPARKISRQFSPW